MRRSSGELHPRRFAAKKIERRGQGDAPEQGKRMGRASGLRAIYLAGDGRVSAADCADSGELLRRPGGAI